MTNENGRRLLAQLLHDYPGEMRTWGLTPDEEAVAEARALLAAPDESPPTEAERAFTYWLCASGGAPCLVEFVVDSGREFATVNDGLPEPSEDALRRLTPGRWWMLDRDGALVARRLG